MKSGKWDTPVDFASDMLIDKYHIEYIDLHEIAQGSPLVGYLSINGNEINGYRFSGPFLLEVPYLYIPALVRSSFMITRIDLRNNELVFLGHLRDYISLEKLENNKISFYDSSVNTSLKIFDMNDYRKSGETDTPVHFIHTIQTERHLIEYRNVVEILGEKIGVGSLYINDLIISKRYFGAPFLYTESDIILPVLIRTMWKNSFKIGLIDLINNELKIIGEKKDLIFLEKVADDMIYYYTDLEKSVLYHLQIP